MTVEDTASLADAESYCPACNRSYAVTVPTCPQDGTRLVRFGAEVDPLIGRVLDERFEVRARLGRGGMGTVYRAWQRSVDREVAIKVIDPRLAHDRTAAKRFLREARLASRLAQPSIVHVHDFGQTEDGVLFLAMELLRGRTLAQLLAAERLTVRRALGIAAQLCDALEAAHGQGIVHRDLKPQNVVVLDDPPGRDLVKVLDFGLAKSLVGDGTTITRDDALLGTPLYLAPEVIGGATAEPASDLYSLGCILHELLAGAPPFRDVTANAVLARHLTEAPPALPAGVPVPVRELVAALLAKQPADRPPSAAAVRTVVLEVVAGGGAALDAAPGRSAGSAAPRGFAAPLAGTPSTVGAAHAGTPEPSAPRPARRWLPWTLAAALAAGVVTTWQLTRSPSGASRPPSEPVRPPDTAVPGTSQVPDPTTPAPSEAVPGTASGPVSDTGRAAAAEVVDAGVDAPPAVDAAAAERARGERRTGRGGDRSRARTPAGGGEAGRGSTTRSGSGTGSGAGTGTGTGTGADDGSSAGAGSGSAAGSGSTGRPDEPDIDFIPVALR